MRTLGRVVSRKLFVVGCRAQRGLSLIEILIVIAIMLILATMLGTMLSRFNSVQELHVGSGAAASVFERARARSMSGINGTPHGVHIASTTLTLFVGNTYDVASTTNETAPLMGKLEIVQISVGGGSDVVFNQLTGATSQPGSIVLQIEGDSSRQRTITISATGAVGVQ